MERVNRILSNGLYQEYQKEIDDREKDRIYCRHNIAHLMDVARIAEILNCENGSLVSKELIYATALLHDCGRHIQYDKNVPHEIVGAELAEPILRDCGFEEEEILHILQAIRLNVSGILKLRILSLYLQQVVMQTVSQIVLLLTSQVNMSSM